MTALFVFSRIAAKRRDEKGWRVPDACNIFGSLLSWACGEALAGSCSGTPMAQVLPGLYRLNFRFSLLQKCDPRRGRMALRLWSTRANGLSHVIPSRQLFCNKFCKYMCIVTMAVSQLSR